MPRKKQSKEEILQKAKLARRAKYAKIKDDPALYALEKEKEHQRYLKRKEQKKIVGIEEMTPRAKRQQRKKWRENFRNHYHRKLLHKRGLDLMTANSPSCSEGEDLPIQRRRQDIYPVCDIQKASTSSNSKPVKESKECEFNKDTNLFHKKIRQLRHAFFKKEKIYKYKIECLQSKVEKFRKMIQRLKKRLQSPNTKATNLLKDKTKVNEAKKKILFGEAMKKTLEESYKESQSKKYKKLFSDTIIKNNMVLKESKVLCETKNFTVRKKKVAKKCDPYEKIKLDIISFFENDDVSRMTPGKKEYISRCRVKKQKRYLLDTMKNLHKIFERQFTKISYSYFCKQRPFWVLIPDVNDRETCLCKIHANLDMLIGALYKRKILKEKYYKDVIESMCCQKPECLLKRCNACKFKNLEYYIDKEDVITYGKWEYRIEKYKKGNIEKEKRIIAKTKQSKSPKEAIIDLEKVLPEFLKHEGTRRWQFNAIQNLKTNLKSNEVIIHIDFSENYSFKYESEVQAFHFGGSREELTLHTVVIYFPGASGKLTCQSFCTVSKNMRHDAAAVWAHIVPVLEFIETTNKGIDTLHFISDSPSSQYRNKTMFYIISKLYWFFSNLKAVTWNYSEAGHGKGAADGVGGTVKRTADLAVANGNDIVSMEDFIKVVSQNAEKIILKPVHEHEIYEKDLLIPTKQLKTLKGTLKVHQVLWQKDKCLIFREVSCFDCSDMACNHTNFVGKLTYSDVDNKECENVNTTTLSYRVQPKTTLLYKHSRKTSTVTSKMIRTKMSSEDHNKENVKISSNIMVKAPHNDSDKVSLLSAVTPDNKLHLGTDVDINHMVSMYNISTVNANFSGLFESPTQTPLPEDGDNIPTLQPDGSTSLPMTSSNMHRYVEDIAEESVKEDFDTKSSDSLEVFPTKRFGNFKSIPLKFRNLELSDDDDEYEILPRSKKFFK